MKNYKRQKNKMKQKWMPIYSLIVVTIFGIILGSCTHIAILSVIVIIIWIVVLTCGNILINGIINYVFEKKIRKEGEKLFNYRAKYY